MEYGTLTAQVAVEAMIDHPERFTTDDKVAVLRFAQEQHVANFYLNMLRDQIPTAALDRPTDWN